MKNVGILVRTLNYGGAERAAARISKILSNKYNIYFIVFETTYMKYDYAGTLINLNVPKSNNLLIKLLRFFKRVKLLKKVKKEKQLDTVISFLYTPNFVNILSKTKNCKTIISIRNYPYKENKLTLINRILEYFKKWIFKKADLIILVSEEIKKYCIQEYKFNADKLKVIYNPYDVIEITKLSEENIDDYSDFFSNSNVIISVGRIVYQKGFWHLIKAFKLASEKYDDLKLAIVGSDFMEGNCQKLVEELGIKNKVLFTGPQKNPFKYMKHSCLYVLSSLFEGFPNSLVEAMACKVPVIAADCKSGPREILFKEPDLERSINDIEYADYGIIIPALESKEDFSLNFSSGEKKLAEAILALMKDEQLRKEYSERAQRRAEDFSYQTCKEKFVQVVEI